MAADPQKDYDAKIAHFNNQLRAIFLGSTNVRKDDILLEQALNFCANQFALGNDTSFLVLLQNALIKK